MPINNASSMIPLAAIDRNNDPNVGGDQETKSKPTSVKIGFSNHQVSQGSGSSTAAKLFVGGLALLAAANPSQGAALGSSQTDDLNHAGNNGLFDFETNPCGFFVPTGFENRTEAVETFHDLGITSIHTLIFTPFELASMREQATEIEKNDKEMEAFQKKQEGNGYSAPDECPPYKQKDPKIDINSTTRIFVSAGDEHKVGKNAITSDSMTINTLLRGGPKDINELENTYLVKATYPNTNSTDAVQLDHANMYYYRETVKRSIVVETRLYAATNSNNQTELSFDGLNAKNATVELISYLDADREIEYDRSDECLAPYAPVPIDNGIWQRFKTYIFSWIW